MSQIRRGGPRPNARTAQPHHSATTRRHQTFVPPASRRRLCPHPPRSNKTPKIRRKKLSAPNHSSIYFSTALQAQKFQRITQASRQRKRRRPRQTRKAKPPHHPNPSRELAPHFPPSTGANAARSTSNAATSPSSATAPQSTAEIPAADLAPLYNYVQDCRACQLQLTAAKQNATDDAAKIRALTLERDATITAAKGGPFWLRLKRNAHWLAIGAAAGAVTSTVALCHTGHCR